MARGKYASRAESAGARESAIQEAERLRGEVERLTRELLRQRESAERREESYQAMVARLSDQLDRATSEALDRANERADRLASELRDVAGQFEHLRAKVRRDFVKAIRTDGKPPVDNPTPGTEIIVAAQHEDYKVKSRAALAW